MSGNPNGPSIEEQEAMLDALNDRRELARKSAFNCNLSGKGLASIKAVLDAEYQEIGRITDLCIYSPAIEAGKQNMARIQKMIDEIDAILFPQ